jgi:acetyltransferase
VALKIHLPNLTHKSDVGGVALDLDGPDRVRSEARSMLTRVAPARPEAQLDGFLAQQMAQFPGAIELIIGIVEDKVFGPVVMFGHGGTAVEQIRDTALALPPLNQALAHAMMALARVAALARVSRSACGGQRWRC